MSLTPELKRVVKRRVASGRYSSASEVVREALRLLEQRDKAYLVRLKQLRADIDVGLQDLAALLVGCIPTGYAPSSAPCHPGASAFSIRNRTYEPGH